MNNPKHTELRKLAEAAIPDPYDAPLGDWVVALQARSDFRTASNPQAIIALLDERDSLSSQVEALSKALEEIELAAKRDDRDRVLDLCAQAKGGAHE